MDARAVCHRSDSCGVPPPRRSPRTAPPASAGARAPAPAPGPSDPRRTRRSLLALGLLAVLIQGCASERSALERAFEQSPELQRGARTVGGELRLDCSPPDAEVLLDSILQGTCGDFTEVPLHLDESAHVVEVRKPGFVAHRVHVHPGQARTSLHIALTGSP